MTGSELRLGDPCLNRLSGLVGQLELDRLSRLLLHDGGPGNDPTAMRDITYLEFDGASGSPTPIDTFKEVTARYTWLALALLDIAVPIIAGIVSMIVILGSASRPQLLAISVTGTLLIALSITHMFYKADGLHEMIYWGLRPNQSTLVPR